MTTFYDKKIETGFKDLRTYALAQREKKRQLNYYPRYSGKLELQQMKNDEDDGELHKDFGETEYASNEVRWYVFLGTQLISYTLRELIFAELIFAFVGPFREVKFREIYKIWLDRENKFRGI